MDSRDVPDMPLPLPLFEGNTPVFSIREEQHRPQGHLPVSDIHSALIFLVNLSSNP